MTTDALIEALAADVRKVSRHVVTRRLLLALAIGTAVTVLVIKVALAFRPDLAMAVGTFPFWMKGLYTAAVAAGLTGAVARLSRPEPASLLGYWPILLPVVVLAGIALIQLAGSPLAHWQDLWLGNTWKKCSALVLLLSLPILAALLLWLRLLAPTRLRAAGAVAGLTAGAWAATVYGLHCPEVAAPFVFVWYSLGIVLAGLIGALLGPRVLRW